MTHDSERSIEGLAKSLNKMAQMKQDLKNALGKIASSGSGTEARRVAVTQCLDLLDQGADLLGPQLTFESAIKCYYSTSITSLENRALNIAKKIFPLYANLNPQLAFNAALSNQFLQSAEDFLEELARTDIPKACEYGHILHSEAHATGSKDAIHSTTRIFAKLDHAKNLRHQSERGALQDYLLTPIDKIDRLGPDEIEKYLGRIFETSRFIPQGSMDEHLAAGIWADLFDRYVLADHDKAIRLGFEMGKNAPPGGALARQIAASLLGVRDPQQTPSLPSPSGGAPLPLFKTRTLG